MPMRRLAEERSRLFDQQAECYDRCRPAYPGVVIDALLSPEPAGLGPVLAPAHADANLPSCDTPRVQFAPAAM